MSPESNLPSPSEKPSLLDWLETFLPFKLPRIPLVQTAKNLDKAVATIALAGGENIAARIHASTTVIAARGDAKKSLVEYGKALVEGQPANLSDRALEYALGDALKKQENREAILSIAADDLNTSPPKEDAPQTIDDDWLDAFKRYAETKSNADIQQLWARILSSEIRKPGSTSLRTLGFLSTISSDDANFVVKSFTYVMDGVFIPSWVETIKRMTYGELLRLYELGITTAMPGIGGTQINKANIKVTLLGVETNAVFVRYYGKVYFCENLTEELVWQIPACPLSQVGRELFSLTNTKVADYTAVEEFAMATKPGNSSKVSVYETLNLGDNFAPIGIPKMLLSPPPS